MLLIGHGFQNPSDGMRNAPVKHERAHGYPARVLLMGLYGIKNVKWVSEPDLVEADFKGYWQTRGWTDTVVYKTISRIDVPSSGATLTRGSANWVAGVVLGGDRGIRAVEAPMASTRGDPRASSPRWEPHVGVWAVEGTDHHRDGHVDGARGRRHRCYPANATEAPAPGRRRRTSPHLGDCDVNGFAVRRRCSRYCRCFRVPGVTAIAGGCAPSSVGGRPRNPCFSLERRDFPSQDSARRMCSNPPRTVSEAASDAIISDRGADLAKCPGRPSRTPERPSHGQRSGNEPACWDRQAGNYLTQRLRRAEPAVREKRLGHGCHGVPRAG